MTPGFFGKLPAKGDFIQRRLEPGFTGAWDNWLQTCMETSKAELGSGWLETYLVSPIWRFALAPNLLSQNAMVGVVMPSVDSVGRYFPLTIAVEVAKSPNLMQLACSQDPWFEAIEDIALYGLSGDFNFSIFEQKLEQSALVETSIDVQSLSDQERRLGWSADQHNGSELIVSGMLSHFGQTVLARYTGYSLWWTTGAQNVAPATLIYEGLPPALDYRAFLNGVWTHG